jgi:hypothetical protein
MIDETTGCASNWIGRGHQTRVGCENLRFSLSNLQINSGQMVEFSLQNNDKNWPKQAKKIYTFAERLWVKSLFSKQILIIFDFFVFVYQFLRWLPIVATNGGDDNKDGVP